MSENYNLQIGCNSTNKKVEVSIYGNIILLKSYDTFISLFDTNKGLLINNFDWFKSSATTRKHFSEFKRHLNRDLDYEIKHECFIDNKEFYELVNLTLFNDLGNVDIKISNIFKEYQIEKTLIEALTNYEFNLNENYKFNIGSCNTVKTEVKELKTRIKEVYVVEIPNELFKPQIEVVITTNKKRNKILSSKVNLISKRGLSYNNYNTKELNYYNGYDIVY